MFCAKIEYSFSEGFANLYENFLEVKKYEYLLGTTIQRTRQSEILYGSQWYFIHVVV